MVTVECLLKLFSWFGIIYENLFASQYGHEINEGHLFIDYKILIINGYCLFALVMIIEKFIASVVQ